MSYKSPIEVYMTQIQYEREKTIEGEVFNAIQKLDIAVAKDELIKALNYDRQQYDKGYEDGYNADKWINCSDRLPEFPTTCIVTVGTKYAWEKEYTYDTDVAFYNADGEWETWNDWDEGNEVRITHWQPLPNIPNKFAIIKKEKSNG